METFTRVGERIGKPMNLNVYPLARSSNPTATTDVIGYSVSDLVIETVSGVLDSSDPNSENTWSVESMQWNLKCHWLHGAKKLVAE